MISDLSQVSRNSSIDPLYPSRNITENSIRIPDSPADVSFPKESVRLSLSPEAQKFLKNNGEGRKNGEVTNETPPGDLQCGPKSRLQLSPEQLTYLEKLKTTDLHVRTHEGQHMAIAGAYAIGGPRYSYTKGPDGRMYATGGAVKLDTSPIPNNPAATIKKAQILRQAALAPSDPSGADRAIASAASKMEMKARQELKENPEGEKTGRTFSHANDDEKKKSAGKFRVYFNSLKTWRTGQIINGYA